MSSQSRFETALATQTMAVAKWCARVGWDASRLDLALTDIGLKDLGLYHEAPYADAIRAVSEFLVHGDAGICVIDAPHGYGKTSFGNYVMGSLRASSTYAHRYFFVMIEDPGLLTHVQIYRDIARAIGVEKPSRSLGDVRALVRPLLVQARDRGITTIVWFDEGQKLTPDAIAMIRGLGDTQTAAGRRACKVIITGTPLMCDRFDRFELSRPEELQAFKDRIALNRISLAPWSQADIWAWWEQLTRVMGGSTPPFVLNDAELTLFALTDGVPRSVIQGTRYAIAHAATAEIPMISGADIAAALRAKLRKKVSKNE